MQDYDVNIFNGQMGFCDGEKDRMTQDVRVKKDGAYKVLIYKEPDWNVTQLRKYFHVAVLPHFVKGYQHMGWGTYGNDDVKDFLKAKYIGYDTSKPLWRAVKMLDGHYSGNLMKPSAVDIQTFAKTVSICAEVGIVLPILSSTELKNKDLYGQFIRSCDALSMERFKCNIPPATPKNTK